PRPVLRQLLREILDQLSPHGPGVAGPGARLTNARIREVNPREEWTSGLSDATRAACGRAERRGLGPKLGGQRVERLMADLLFGAGCDERAPGLQPRAQGPRSVRERADARELMQVAEDLRGFAGHVREAGDDPPVDARQEGAALEAQSHCR